MDELHFRRMRWNSQWMILYGPITAFGVWCLLQQIWNGFSEGSTIAGVISAGLGLTVCLCCLETVQIDENEIQLRLGQIILRRIPTESIRTLVRTYVSVGKGGSCAESIIILSPHSQKELRKRSNENPDRYYNTRVISGIMSRSEGLWLQYSEERMKQLHASLPNATEYLRN